MTAPQLDDALKEIERLKVENERMSGLLAILAALSIVIASIILLAELLS